MPVASTFICKKRRDRVFAYRPRHTKRSEAQQKARSGGKPHRQDLHVNASSLRSFDFRQGRSVSCIPQAPFPFSLDVVLSLGLCGRLQDIIYCLFSKANVQTWHISFAEHIIIKIWFPPTSFFLFRTVLRNDIWGISDSWPHCEFLANNIYKTSEDGQPLCEEGRLEKSVLWKGKAQW